MRSTYFIDIDGTLLEHIEDFENIDNYDSLRALPGAKEKTSKWHCEGHMIILTTARPESLRRLTEKQLRKAGVIYDMIIMGIGAGPRTLINDYQEGKDQKAYSYNVLRNVEGIKNVP
jgi:ribonucleotide monophosphatase NagD (HAD superfamily)